MGQDRIAFHERDGIIGIVECLLYLRRRDIRFTTRPDTLSSDQTGRRETESWGQFSFDLATHHRRSKSDHLLLEPRPAY